MMPVMRRAILISSGVAGALLLAASQPAFGSPVWLAVTHTTKARGKSYPENVRVDAEQSAQPFDKSAAGPVYGGEAGPTTLRTRRLTFNCRSVSYAVPEAFAGDLLWLGADSSVRASLSTRDAVFTMIGSSGEHQYTVHFDFRGGRFFQRILEYGEAHTMLIRTLTDNAGAPGASPSPAPSPP